MLIIKVYKVWLRYAVCSSTWRYDKHINNVDLSLFFLFVFLINLSLFSHHVCKIWTKLLREIKDLYFAYGDNVIYFYAVPWTTELQHLIRDGLSHLFLFTTAWHKWQVICAALKESNIPFHAFFLPNSPCFCTTHIWPLLIFRRVHLARGTGWGIWMISQLVLTL